MSEFDEKLNTLLSNPESMAQIMQLAKSLSGQEQGDSPPQPEATPPPKEAGAPPLDPQLIARFMPLFQELNGQQNSQARQLLYALSPYLRTERQEKVERALQLARLIHVGKKFLAGWEG